MTVHLTPSVFATETFEKALEQRYYTVSQDASGPDYIKGLPKKGKEIDCCGRLKSQRDDQNGAFLTVVFIPFSFFLGLFYSIRSLKEAIDYNQKNESALAGIRANTPPEKSLYSFSNTQGDASPEDLLMFKDSSLIWKKMYHERITACICQILMTIGAGILTVGLALAFTAYGPISLLKPMAIVGGGFIAFGLVGYGVKKIILNFSQEKAACLRLANYPSAYTNKII